MCRKNIIIIIKPYNNNIARRWYYFFVTTCYRISESYGGHIRIGTHTFNKLCRRRPAEVKYNLWMRFFFHFFFSPFFFSARFVTEHTEPATLSTSCVPPRGSRLMDLKTDRTHKRSVLLFSFFFLFFIEIFINGQTGYSTEETKKKKKKSIYKS